MKIQTVKITPNPPRFVIIVQGKPGTKSLGILNFMACMGSTQILLSWIKLQGGLTYISRPGRSPIVVDSYSKLTRAFAKEKTIELYLRNGSDIDYFTASKLPVLTKHIMA